MKKPFYRRIKHHPKRLKKGAAIEYATCMADSMRYYKEDDRIKRNQMRGARILEIHSGDKKISIEYVVDGLGEVYIICITPDTMSKDEAKKLVKERVK